MDSQALKIKTGLDFSVRWVVVPGPGVEGTSWPGHTRRSGATGSALPGSGPSAEWSRWHILNSSSNNQFPSAFERLAVFPENQPQAAPWKPGAPASGPGQGAAPLGPWGGRGDRSCPPHGSGRDVWLPGGCGLKPALQSRGAGPFRFLVGFDLGGRLHREHDEAGKGGGRQHGTLTGPSLPLK